jgi:hypothetical protein
MLSIRLAHHSFTLLIPIRGVVTHISTHLLNCSLLRHSEHNRASLICFDNSCSRRSLAIVLHRALKLLLILMLRDRLFRFIFAFFR